MFNIDSSSLSAVTENPLAFAPVFSNEAEQAVLGAMLIDPEVVPVLINLLNCDHFYAKAHGFIFSACSHLASIGRPVDIIEVAEILSDRGLLTSVGGRAYVNELALSVLTTGNVEFYAERIKDLAGRRAAKDFFLLMASKANTTDFTDLISEATKSITSLAENTTIKKQMTYEEQLEAAVESVRKELEYGEAPGFLTGYPTLDSLGGGLGRDTLNIFAARTNVGKSMFSLNLIKNALDNEIGPIVIFSHEMSVLSMNRRLFQMFSEDRLTVAGALKAQKIMEKKQLRLFRLPLTVEQMRLECLRLQAEMGPIAMVFVDYLQRVPASTAGRKFNNKNDEIQHISGSLKALGGELDCAVNALCQINRGAATDVPELHHLKDCGAIEEDADTVFMLHNPDCENTRIKDLYCKKSRNSEGDFKVPLVFNPKTLIIKEVQKC